MGMKFITWLLEGLLLMILINNTQGRYINPKRIRRSQQDMGPSTPTPSNNGLRAELRELIAEYDSNRISLDELLQSLASEFDYEFIDDGGYRFNPLTDHRLRHKNFLDGPISLTLEMYLLAEQARRNEESNGNDRNRLMESLIRTG